MTVSIIHSLALILSGLFAGGALMESVVGHPARLAAARTAGLDVMQHVLRRADPHMPILALSGFATGAASFAFDGPVTDLLAAMLLIAMVPFTLIAISPINRRLLGSGPSEAESETARGLMKKWQRLHATRTAGGCLALILVAMPVPT